MSGWSYLSSSRHKEECQFHCRVHVLTCTHAHTHSDLDNLDTPINLTCTPLECGRKLEYPEKNRTDMERMCKLHTDSGPSQASIFFLKNIITKQYWMKQCYSRTYCKLCTWLITELSFWHWIISSVERQHSAMMSSNPVWNFPIQNQFLIQLLLLPSPGPFAESFIMLPE